MPTPISGIQQLPSGKIRIAKGSREFFHPAAPKVPKQAPPENGCPTNASYGLSLNSPGSLK
jgi:hypothetical protein